MKIKRRTVAIGSRQITSSFKAAPDGELKRELHGNRKVSLAFQMPMRGTAEDIERAREEIRSGARLAAGKSQFLSPEERSMLLGASDEHIMQLKRVARKCGLKALRRTREDLVHGLLRIEGRYSAFKKLLPGVHFAEYTDKDGKHIGRSGMYSIRADAPPIDGVFDGDNRKAANYYYREYREPEGMAIMAKPHGTPSGMTARENAIAWGFPAAAYNNSPGLVTAYISLGGDNAERMQQDVKTICEERGIPVPKFHLVYIGGAKNGKYRDGATVENLLDIYEHALLNPSGHVVIFVADNDDGAFAEAMETAATFKGVKEGNTFLPLRAVSISWGSPESGNTVQSLRRWERAVLSAELGGLVVTAATGDDGSRDKTSLPTPDAPSCVPGVIGAAGVGFSVGNDGKVSEIHIWPDTGGGVSAVFDPMAAEVAAGVVQKSVQTGRPGHNASLLAYEAEPASGPEVLYNGRRSKVGGTSDASPGLAAMLGRIQHEMAMKYGVVVPDIVGFIHQNAGAGITFKLSRAGSNGDYRQSPDDLNGVPVGFGPINYAGMLAAAEKVAAELAKKKKTTEAA